MCMIALAWIFCAVMVNLTLTRRYSCLHTALLWIGGFLTLVVLTSFVDVVYEACAFLIPSGYDFISLLADCLFVTVVGVWFVFVSWKMYRGTPSSKIFIASYMRISINPFFNVNHDLWKIGYIPTPSPPPPKKRKIPIIP
ncbi:MAG: hypothetical protein ALMCE001_17210 [Methanocorpusculum sp. MCE]|nr:MAG: hypothetical protein ALMCE001_17210 [Methanocorpusculum sp. MCE]